MALLASTSLFVEAQTEPRPIATTNAMLSLPDAPSASNSIPSIYESSSSSNDTDSSANPGGGGGFDPAAVKRRILATRSDITIYPGQTAPPLSAHDKEIMGFKQSFTLFSLIGWTTSAGYTQLVNGSPNYGTDSGAFGERLGAAALRNTTQNIFGNVVFAPLFHEDPRYYKMGKGNNFFKRVIYSATRAVVTRTDDGRATPNYSLVAGRVFGAALTNAYYPQTNRGFTQTLETFGTSMGGAATGFVVTEFLDEALEIVHLKKPE
ncbi:hypothetical protein [Tunturiibacter lichenicola]|uniref:hypothetical protein n=1 Tax=Tunturiibacter lichenicola TaxID=2051959 RepID=UPI0021B3BB16|nr:hypothetical protein [Edaphobacter lichenicola]